MANFMRKNANDLGSVRCFHQKASINENILATRQQKRSGPYLLQLRCVSLQLSMFSHLEKGVSIGPDCGFDLSIADK